MSQKANHDAVAHAIPNASTEKLDTKTTTQGDRVSPSDASATQGNSSSNRMSSVLFHPLAKEWPPNISQSSTEWHDANANTPQHTIEATDVGTEYSAAPILPSSQDIGAATSTARLDMSAGRSGSSDQQATPAIDQQATPAIDHTTGLQGPLPTQQMDHSDENEALSVRTNMLRSWWDGYTSLTKFRRWILALRLLIGLIQVVAGIVVLALPTSLGDSMSYPETCDPEGMFVYLVLHVARLVCSVPVDVYLGLSPHRSPRARRRGAEGLLERERNRRVGSLHLDRKMGRFSDLLGFCHIVLFIVGNYVVWTSVECSHSPADSQPLFFTCVAMLSITYLVILVVALMVFLVIFFLPLLIAILNALGLSHRLPQRDIHPETGKIGQDDIEKHSKLVYYTPMIDESIQEAKAEEGTGEEHDVSELSAVTAESQIVSAETTVTSSVQEARSHSRRARFGRLIGLSRQQSDASTAPHAHGGRGKGKASSSQDTNRRKGAERGNGDGDPDLPLYPIPSHRATCPICLSDYEDAKVYFDKGVRGMSGTVHQRGGQAPNGQLGAQRHQPDDAAVGSAAVSIDREGGDEIEAVASTSEDVPPAPEPLRLLRCGHAMHKACVDQWLTAVSGRCPVCQRPIIDSDEEAKDPITTRQGQQQEHRQHLHQHQHQ